MAQQLNLTKKFIFTSYEPDIPFDEAPAHIISEASNISFNNNVVEKSGGELYVLGTSSGLPITPLYLMAAELPGEFFWILPGASQIYVLGLDEVSTDVTPITSFSAVDLTDISGAVFNDHVVVNSRLSDPVYWDGNTANNMLKLPGWPVGTTCNRMRTYKGFLLALGINNGAGTFNNRIKWSSSSDAGAIPQSWDETDPTLDAGEATLSTVQGDIIDCLPLGDYNIIYKENSTHLMRFVGGRFVFSFRDLFYDSGIISRDCVVEVNNQHVVMTKYDIIIHNGSELRSIVTDRLRRFIFQETLNIDKLSQAFLTHYKDKDEVWICYVVKGRQLVEHAIVWNYVHDTFTLRTLQDTFAMSYGFSSTTVIQKDWDGDSETWDSDESSWLSNAEDNLLKGLVGLNLNKLVRYDIGEATVGSSGQLLSGISKLTTPFSDDDSIAIVKRIIPKIKGIKGDIIEFRFGTQMNISDEIVWEDFKPFVIGTDYSITQMAKGRYISLQIQSGLVSDVGQWRLHSVLVEYDLNERY